MEIFFLPAGIGLQKGSFLGKTSLVHLMGGVRVFDKELIKCEARSRGNFVSEKQEKVDVVILGAGGAGLMCAATAGKRGRRVVVIDHAERLGKKILMSGGGRCNFTNINANAGAYVSENIHFAKSALARFTPKHFLALVEKHRVPFYEKKLGQLFCTDSAQRIVELLENECREYGAEIRLGETIQSVRKMEDGFAITLRDREILAESVVVATGGLSIPKIGATNFGYKIAESFGISVTALSPALVSLTLDADFGELSGFSVDATVEVNGVSFRENILFTHTGLSGPAILQASLYWNPGDTLEINLAPDLNVEQLLMNRKLEGQKKEIKNIIGELFSERFADIFLPYLKVVNGPLNQMPNAKIIELAKHLHNWKVSPKGTGGYGKAEVTRGGVSTDELSSKNLESKKVAGLYFIGEVVDVTGRLGGYNFQWAWASGSAAGETV